MYSILGLLFDICSPDSGFQNVQDTIARYCRQEQIVDPKILWVLFWLFFNCVLCFCILISYCSFTSVEGGFFKLLKYSAFLGALVRNLWVTCLSSRNWVDGIFSQVAHPIWAFKMTNNLLSVLGFWNDLLIGKENLRFLGLWRNCLEKYYFF